MWIHDMLFSTLAFHLLHAETGEESLNFTDYAHHLNQPVIILAIVFWGFILVLESFVVVQFLCKCLILF